MKMSKEILILGQCSFAVAVADFLGIIIAGELQDKVLSLLLSFSLYYLLYLAILLYCLVIN